MVVPNDDEKARLRGILKDKGINPSYHRLIILHELSHRQDHPSAEQIYGALRDHLPTLSRTTVYNTLALFEDHALIRSLPMPGYEKHYDHDLYGDIHFFCLACHTIHDALHPSAAPSLSDQFPEYEIHHIQTFIRGLCPLCYQKTIIQPDHSKGGTKE